jgi:peptidoglycan/LPS O-acetylase OafA/YrhL
MVVAAPVYSGRANGRLAPPRPTRPFRRDIEGLRAIAVIAVVLGHAGIPFVHGGYVGVDVFFVISGFLITTLLWQEVTTTGRVGIAAFYARRALRLLPAAILVIAATLVATWLWLPGLRLRSVAVDAMTAAVYGLNLRLAGQGTDYFGAEAAPSPLQHFWSLAVEEQFYLVWPVLLAATVVWSRRRLRRWPAIAAVGAVAAASFAVGVVQTTASPAWAYFGTPARAWELAVGALLALCAHHLTALPRAAVSALTWCGLAAIVASVLLYTDATPFPGVAALLPVAGTAAILAAGCSSTDTAAHRLLGTGVCQGIGRLSYSWYLWHWPVLVIVPVAFDLEVRTGQGVVLAVWSLILAGVTYVLVEDPVRTGRWLRSAPWRGMTLGASLSAGLATAALAAVYLVPPPAGSGHATDTRAALASSSAALSSLAELVAAGAEAHHLPANLTPSLGTAGADRPRLYVDDCDPSFTEQAIERVCEYGDPTSSTEVVLFGDSHAGHWFPALERLAAQRHWRLIVLTKSACSAASVLIHLPALKRPYTECVAWRRAALARIRDLRPDLVVMSSSGGGSTPLEVTGDPGSGGAPAVGTVDADQMWTAGWVATARQARADGTRLVAISDTPWPTRGVLDCLSEHPDEIDRCVRPVARAVNEGRRRIMVADALNREDVLVIDPLPWFCTETVCPVVVGNTLVYKDGSHMTTAYAEALAPVLGARLPLD